ncbi:putative multidrug export ATP-binding/permease protein [Clostridium tepidiprofundi DSM 19306]|uniref:Putative multidrug export ATP-binding/permease protein n=1 Tax=Clostridium tepidiprofundi DSM 19306 TaxID=1121338 RepID=A0A151B2E0_9CLOT|nr:ABC transporter ATP-binding protein [Clostridium tepidiprofundi]KYH33963.1 putative multidrug export ATP-binding/permease protein [Clostridium tepidiprofundi DSM 19306]
MLNRIKCRLHIIKKILPFSDGVKWLFWGNAVAGFIMMMISLLNPIFYSMFIEKVILGGKIKYIYYVTGGYLGVLAVTVILSYIQNYCTNTVVNTVTYRIREKILKGWLKKDFVSYEMLNIGDKKMIIDEDTTNMAVFANDQSSTYLTNFLKVVILIICMILIEWRLLIFSLIIIPLTFLADYYISEREEGPKLTLRENDQNWGAWLHSTISNWREIRALNLEKSEEKRFIGFSHNDAVMFSRWNNFWITRRLVIPQFKDVFFMQFSLYLIGGIMILKNQLSIGALLIFVQYYSYLSESITALSRADADLKVSQIYAHKVFDELLELEKNEEKSENKKQEINGYEIAMEHIDFQYPHSEKNILTDFSLQIKQGERLAIIGESGKGKTTILKLICGMLEPTRGVVKFAGLDLKELDISKVHEKMGFVMQENLLFNASIKENLFYAKKDATLEEMEEACKKAYIYEFIRGLPDKFDTVIGEKGIKLSGGQRQRIVLARLFLKNVDVFIFDEATSALDQYSENIIHSAIEAIGKDKTMIVVSHRKSSIELCDRVISV